MKVCFFGLGSIGQHHVRNLTALCNKMEMDILIHALRTSERKISDDISAKIIRQTTDINKLDSDYDIGFITNPTHMHYPTLIQAARRCRHFFIEKPVFSQPHEAIEKIPFAADAVCYVAAPLRFCGVVEYMKRIAEQEAVYSVRAICSSYLPDWRPGQDYRNTYSAKRAEGGGVCLDIIHEMDYLTYMFGFPKKICVFSGKYSDLEIDSEDLAAYIAMYQDKLIELHLDYFGKKRTRSLTFYTKAAVIEADIDTGTVWSSAGTYQAAFNEDINERYLREMAYFIRLCLGEEGVNINPIQRAVDVLNLTSGILPKN